jgi:hypothetical protein
MFDHLDHWKTYPAKSSFSPRDATRYKGEKVFEQPLIAALSGEQSIPPLGFSYFNPKTGQYERARTQPIKVTVLASLAGEAVVASLASQASQRLRPDHPRPRSPVSDLKPLYFQAPFLAVPATLVLILVAGWYALRPQPTRATSEAAERALAKLDAAARTGDSASFFDVARKALLQTFAARWQMSPEEITVAELKSRLGGASNDIERLLSLADEAKYSDQGPAAADYQRWLGLIRDQLGRERE